MMSFSEYTYFVRFTQARISSYSVSLLYAGKSSWMACSIISPIGALNCKLTPAPVWQEVSSTSRIHHPALPWSISDWGISAKKSANIYPINAKRGLY